MKPENSSTTPAENQPAMTKIIHDFEASGLGLAPYRCLDVKESDGVCAHCGKALKWLFTIKSADAVLSVVGSTCIEKTHIYLNSVAEGYADALSKKNELAKSKKRASLVATRAAKRTQMAASSEYIGEVGKTVSLRVRFYAYIPSAYSTILKGETDNGSAISWFAGSAADTFDYSTCRILKAHNDFVDLSGTVAKHSEYDGLKETTIKNVTLPPEYWKD